MELQIRLVLLGASLSLAGAVVVFVLNWWAVRLDRKKELRSILAALLWELKDATRFLGAAGGLLKAPFPSVETLLNRGLLVRLRANVSSPLLHARSILGIYNRTVAQYLQETALSQQERIDALRAIQEEARLSVPFLEAAIKAIESYLGADSVPR
jgi:hypothetical protein